LLNLTDETFPRGNQFAQLDWHGRHSLKGTLILLTNVADGRKQHFMDRAIVASQVDDESAPDGSNPEIYSKLAIEVTIGFGPPAMPAESDGKRSVSACEAYGEMIAVELSLGRNAMAIWQVWSMGTGLRGRLPERQAFRAQAARSGIAGSAGDHRDATI
jgi:hypothetical protein